MAYISPDGESYKDYQEYCNSNELGIGDKFRKLLAGSRVPQDDEEQMWLENMRKLQEDGKIVEIPSDII